MKTYLCHYQDVKSRHTQECDIVHAETKEKAFEQFIRNRRKENWTLGQIYGNCHFQLVNTETDERYHLNPHGELTSQTVLYF